MKKLTLAQVKAQIRRLGEGEQLEVGLLPNKANPYSVWISPVFVNVSDIKKLEEYINSYAYYNCNNVLGNRVAYWVQN